MGTNITELKQNLWLREQVQDNGNKSISSTGTKNILLWFKRTTCDDEKQTYQYKRNKTILLLFKEQ
jgi:hypothetical protein